VSELSHNWTKVKRNANVEAEELATNSGASGYVVVTGILKFTQVTRNRSIRGLAASFGNVLAQRR
jgi:hypothetical protein